MKICLNLTIEITKDKQENSGLNISVKSKNISEYVIERDELINDKIYPDNYELINMKNIHNKKLDKICLEIFEEMYFQVGRCDIVAAEAVKKEMIKFNEKQAIRDQITNAKIERAEQDRAKAEQDRTKAEQDRTKAEQARLKSEKQLTQRIDLLMQRIIELESKQK